MGREFNGTVMMFIILHSTFFYQIKWAPLCHVIHENYESIQIKCHKLIKILNL